MVSCPFCEATELELISAWGGQLMTSQMRCRTCGAYFEAVREELGAQWAPEPGGVQEACGVQEAGGVQEACTHPGAHRPGEGHPPTRRGEAAWR